MPAFQFDGPQGLARLQSALNTPRLRRYGPIHRRAAAIFRSIIKNHPLVDGNKRLAHVVLRVFMRINAVDFKASDENIARAAIAIASYPGNVPLDAIEKWIRVGCTGRPRKFIASLAEEWPEMRRELLVATRQADIAAGYRARVPGRRVRPRLQT